MKDYHFMHCGYQLVKGINRAFSFACPSLGEFLDSRLVTSKHLATEDLKRKALNKSYTSENDGYITMVADPWQDKKTLCDKLFDPNAFEKDIKLMYLDIPLLHEFGDEG